MHEIGYQQDMDCSGIYQTRQRFSEINVAYVFEYSPSF